MMPNEELIIRITPEEQRISIESTHEGVTARKEIDGDTFLECVKNSIRRDKVESGFLPRHCFHVGMMPDGSRDYCLWYPELHTDISYYGPVDKVPSTHRYPNMALRTLSESARGAQEIANRNIELRQYALAGHLRELMLERNGRRTLWKRLRLFDRREDLLPSLQVTQPQFVEAMLLRHDRFRKGSALCASELLPYDQYFEYPLEGWGERVVFFVFGVPGSRYFVEAVADGKIIAQRQMVLRQEGEQFLEIPSAKGLVYLRFRAVEAFSILRVLEISNRVWGIFARKELAAYIE